VVTKILISVTSLEEARVALANGADIIDLKDPAQGALGALPLDKIAEVVHFVKMQTLHGEKTTSATIGDLPLCSDLITEQVRRLLATQVDIVKIGLFAEPGLQFEDYERFLNGLKSLTAKGAKLIAVLFAEQSYPDGLWALIKNAGFYGVMMDTAVKNGATFLDYHSVDSIKSMAATLQDYGLMFGLAGSLKLQHLVSIKEINPDYVGFRGGVCVNDVRNSSIDSDKILAIRKSI